MLRSQNGKTVQPLWAMIWQFFQMLNTAVPPASLVAQMVKKLPAMRKAWVRSLGWEDALEEGMTTHSSIIA